MVFTNECTNMGIFARVQKEYRRFQDFRNYYTSSIVNFFYETTSPGVQKFLDFACQKRYHILWYCF